MDMFIILIEVIVLQVYNYVLTYQRVLLKYMQFRGTSLEVQWLKFCLTMRGVQVGSLVRKLKSHMPRGQKNQNIKQKWYCNKFNKNFKMVHTKKKIIKKIYIVYCQLYLNKTANRSDRRGYYSESPSNQLKINNPTEKWANDHYRKIIKQELHGQPY